MSERFLWRYTDLTSIIYALRTKALTLLDPSLWDDKNDSHFLTLYKEKSKFKSVLALCFTENDERYHYWKVFGAGAAGVCIKFNRACLQSAVDDVCGVTMRSVRYTKLKEIEERQLRIRELPFLKRFGYEHEKERRIIYQSRDNYIKKLDVIIPLASIVKITLSPWLHPDLVPSVRGTLKAIDACEDLNIARSTLINNNAWRAWGDDAI